MKNVVFQNKCAKKLAEANITGEDIFNLIYSGWSLISLSSTVKKFENCGLNPWFFRDYFLKSSFTKTQEEQEDLEEQLDYDLSKTTKWQYKNKKKE